MSLLKGFNDYINEQITAIFEASELSKTGMPKEMISAIHQKAEQKAEDFPNLGFVYRSENPLVLPYKYITPSHKIEVGTPQVFTGRKVADPAGTRKSMYPDIAQFLIDLPTGPLNVLLTSPETDFYMYLYYKRPRQGGEQYAILIWDKNKGNAVDYAYVGLTVEGVNKQLVREVHKTKGGNTNQKVQEIVYTLTGGPTNSKTVNAYELSSEGIDTPTDVRTERKSTKTYGPYATPSLNFIELFASKYKNLLAKQNIFASIPNKIKRVNSANYTTDLPNVSDLAGKLGSSYPSTLGYLYTEFNKFRADLFEQGRVGDVSAKSAYHRTDGYELYAENKWSVSVGLSRKSTGKDLPLSKQYNSPYKFGSVYDPTDPRYTEDEKKSLMRQKGQRVPYHLPSDSVKRSVPDKGNYASIDSIIKIHSLDGAMHRFAWFLSTGKITSPATNFLHALGLDLGGEEEGLGDLEKLVL